MKKIFLITSLFLSFISYSKQFNNNNYYLIANFDSSQVDNLVFQNIKKELNDYHNTKTDSIKINSLRKIVLQLDKNIKYSKIKNSYNDYILEYLNSVYLQCDIIFTFSEFLIKRKSSSAKLCNIATLQQQHLQHKFIVIL